ncbi:MAG: lytic transglycosylase domain-containing protein [Myxococcales bacterium]|jgi:soluble lytic murein transglycosylase
MRAVAVLLTLVVALWAQPGGAAQDPLSPAAARVRAGDVPGALAALDALPDAQQAAPAARYLRARLLAASGETRAALQALPDADAELPEGIAQDVALRRVRWQAATGQCERARGAAERLATESVAPAETWAIAGRCALSAGDAAAAVGALRNAVQYARGRARRAALQGELAGALIAAGNRPHAISTLRELRLNHPDQPAGREAEARLAELGVDTALELPQRIALCERWTELGRPAEGLALLEGAELPKDSRQRAAVLHARGMALFKMRTRYPEAARVLTRAAKLKGAMEAYDSFHAARAWARADRDRRAVHLLRRFARDYPRSSYVDDALYIAAWLELRHDMKGGRRNMQRFLDGEHARGSRLAQGLFHLAMDAFDGGRLKRARGLFERYAATGSGAMVRGRGLYWAGRAAQRARQRETAVALYRQVMELEPLHWYGLLARRRLQELGAQVPPPPPPGPAADAPPAPALPNEVSLLLRIGFDAEARAALRAREDAVRAQAPQGRELETLVVAHRSLGNAARGYRLIARNASRLLTGLPATETRWAWQASYARPHAAAVAEAARREGLPEDLIYAVMRKESAFDPDVVSYADAIGLMQLLPKTGARVAAGLGLDFSRARLKDPDYNVRLGAHYLAQLVKRFDGQVMPAIAAYNAGAHRVEPWLGRARTRRGALQLDRFVESIPIEQTRNYVRRVTTNWARYRFVSDPTSPLWAELPSALRAPSSASSARRRR